MDKIRIGIVGYGNLGRGVECAVRQNPDMEIAGIFTRRDPSVIRPLTEGVKVFPVSELDTGMDIDVLILCSGSATELPLQTPRYASMYNVIDSFDNHHDIPKHFANVDAAAKSSGHLAAISIGWDPGLFSLNRAVATLALPVGENYTFWGRGVSQGHSDAIRRIPGVLDARQYTVPIEEALDAVRSGRQPELSARQKHLRECYVVAAPDADKTAIETAIKTMPNYFADYDTSVTFISEKEMRKNHSALPHGGFVIRTGKTGLDGAHTHRIEYSLALDSNPEFTGSVLVAFARAIVRMAARGETGCVTVFDVAPADLSPLSRAELRRTML